MKIFRFQLSAMMILLVGSLMAKENVNSAKLPAKGAAKIAAGCVRPTANVDMDINNVRCRFLTGGDWWWQPNTSDPRYEVPINSGSHSIYAGALWIGGTDNNGNIKVAAQTYRQTGDDFWAGAVDKNDVNIEPGRCAYYDRHWKISKEEVLNFISDPAKATLSIKEWPGNGNALFNEDQFLAPFKDVDGDGIYDYTKGDFPYYKLSDTDTGDYTGTCNDFVFGDQTIWWVFNDLGNDHTATLSTAAIGVEVQCQAFAFRTNDEINNMTFNKFKVINRSNSKLNSTYFGMWCDPDLGFAADDYVGCDVGLGLGFCYNGDPNDEGGTGYGDKPPAIGIDFFQGPLADPNDGIDNDRDGTTDEPGEQIIMSKFMYYNNVNNQPNGNPDGPVHHYNYLKGIWGDGLPCTYGEDGRNPANAVCDFMFPGKSDPVNFPLYGEWSEVTAGLAPEDRRFLESAGAFTLQPGAVNYITTGVVWARAASGGPLASVALMKVADAKAQSVFDNCFKVIDGPTAPDVAVRELDKQIILTLENYATKATEFYNEVDPTIPGEIPNDTGGLTPLSESERSYKFEGYLVYQLLNDQVTYDPKDLGNPDKARLIAQFDEKNGVTQIINHTWNDNLATWDDVEMVNGKNEGIKHVLKITTDAFGGGNSDLVNYKTYYFTIVAYAYNQYRPFEYTNVPSPNYTQQKPYLPGRLNVRTYTAIPHKQIVENYGQVFNSVFGSRPAMQRIEGSGNGGMILNMIPESRNEALNAPAFRSYFPKYEIDGGPANVAVYDVFKMKEHNFELKFDGVTLGTSQWKFKETASGAEFVSERPYGIPNEQVFSDYGLTADLRDVPKPYDPTAKDLGYLTSSISYADGNRWLSFVKDNDADSVTNWIRSGETKFAGFDDKKVFEGVVGGTWGPFRLLNRDAFAYAPKWSQTLLDQFGAFDSLASVDIIFTNDKSKWTRCIVIEMSNLKDSTEGKVEKFDLRKGASIDKNGVQGDPNAAASDDPNAPNFISSTGMGWFPGYAVNVETGERLNLAYGENSDWDRDMKWNPTSKLKNDTGLAVVGNGHYIYVYGHNGEKPNDCPRYDYGRKMAKLLKSGNATNKRGVHKDIMWAALPLLVSGKSLNESEIIVKIRVAKTYIQYDTRTEIFKGTALSSGTSYNVLNDSIVFDGTAYPSGATFIAGSNNSFTGDGSVVGGASQNGSNPYYKLSTAGMQTVSNSNEAATSALDLINIVPNPYYAYSSYEKNQLLTVVKITNLPSKCTVSIFTTNGILLRKYKRDVEPDNSTGSTTVENKNGDTSIDWDLKNSKFIPVASGIYLIHVEVPGVGTRILKSFVVLRPVDVDTF